MSNEEGHNCLNNENKINMKVWILNIDVWILNIDVWILNIDSLNIEYYQKQNIPLPSPTVGQERVTSP